MKRKKKYTSLGMASLLVSSSVMVAPMATEAETPADQTIGPKLLITEVVRDSKNEVNSQNANFQAYEFIEIYNNSTEAIDLKDYKLMYGYPGVDKAPEDWSVRESHIIQPGETQVIWNKSTKDDIELTVEDFNSTYNTTFDVAQIAIIQTAGIHGTNPRSFTLLDSEGNVVSEVFTNEEGATTTKGESLNYAVAGESKRLSFLADQKAPTPGTVLSEQLKNNNTAEPLPEEENDETVEPPAEESPVENLPEVVHIPLATASKAQPFNVSATLAESVDNVDFALYYRPLIGFGNWMEFDMDVKGQAGVFEGTIPNSLFKTDTFEYKIVAQINGQEVTSENYVVDVNDITFDPQKAPELLITELLPNSKNIVTNGTEFEGYEFIEVYNNSVDTIDLQDYTIQYQGETLVPDEHNVTLQPGETAVYWLMNEGNRDLTLTDFNAQYGSNLTEDQVIRVNGFMTNSSKRTISIISNTGDIVSTASYYDQKSGFGIVDTATGTNVQYAYPQDGSATMVKYDYLHGTGTPGVVEPEQVPTNKVNKGEDTIAPVYEDVTNVDLVHKNETLTVQFSIEDARSIKTAQLFYRFKGEEQYQSVHLLGDGSGIFAHQFAAVNLLNKGEIEYYAKISDGLNPVTTETNTIAIEPAQLKTSGFNVTNDMSVSGIVPVEMYNTTGKLIINGNNVTSNTTQSLADDAHFVFEGAAIDNFFQNGVTVNQQVLSVYNTKIADFEVLTTQIPSSMVKMGEPFKVDLRAGTKVDVIDEGSTENRDDFKMKNPKLVLADGTTLYDTRFTEKDVIYNVGDSSATALPVYTFEFDIPQKYFSAMKYEWDTTNLADGEYTISDGTETIQVKVDNTAPIIESSIKNQETYKGTFTIDAKVTDLSEVQTVHATLDGKDITLPFETGSGALTAGEHTLTITATDSVGNEATKTITFTTVEEQPVITEQPTTKVNGTTAVLSVGVEDPQQDDMTVKFYKGFKYTPGEQDKNITVYEDTSLTEPPRDLPVVEDKLLTVADEKAIEAVDNDYLSVTSNDKYPYHRFEVSVDESVKTDDLLKIKWTGKSLKDRKVSMYLWNYTTGEWNLKTSHIAQDTNDFELTATLPVSVDYVKDGKVQVVVQDEVGATKDYDYSFVWFSDTQYYAESYPEIFDKMTSWIAEKRKELGIEYVFFTGDLVDEADKEYQWQNADKYMKTLDDVGIPYGVLAGNHDVFHTLEDYSKYGQYFGEDRYNNQSHYASSYDNNRGHYDVINIQGTQYVMMYMGWGVNDKDIAWMNDVLAQYPDAIVFLNFHDYVTADATRSTIGDKIYKEVVVPNKNVKAVLAGHIHDAETIMNEIDDNGDGVADRKVYQMLADYQGAPQGGLGYLRILKVNQTNGTIAVETYSPYLDDYNYYDTDDFPGKDSLTMELDYTNSSKEKRVETNAFSLEVLTNEEIGEVQNVKSGTQATFTLSNLQPETPYGWYGLITDEFGGKTETDVTLFTTGEAKEDEGKSSGGDSLTPPSKNDHGGSKGSSSTKENSGSTGVNTVTPPTVTSPVTEKIELDTDGQTTIELKDEVVTLTSTLVTDSVKGQQTLEFVAPDGTHAIFTPKTLAQLQNNKENIELSIAKSKANVAKATTYAQTVTVNVTENGQKIKLDSIDVLIPVDAISNVEHATSIRFNPLTNKWEYNGGKLNGKVWETSVDANTAVTVATNDIEFKDISNHWAKADIEALAAKFIVNGKADGAFAPGATLTRSQFTLMLSRIMKLPLAEYQGAFSDVNAASGIDALQLEAAYRAGITTGKEDGTFAPSAPITRQQMTAMLIRALQYKAPELLEQTSGTQSFTDAVQVSDYASEYVGYAAALGLINGREDGTFAPKENANRAHAAAVMQRLLKLTNE